MEASANFPFRGLQKLALQQWPPAWDRFENDEHLMAIGHGCSWRLHAELCRILPVAWHVLLNVRLNDLTYAPEIAQAMLMRQQAMALIDARKTIVEGAVEIVQDAVARLDHAGLQLSPGAHDALVSNLLVVICGGERPQPVIQVQSGVREHHLDTVRA